MTILLAATGARNVVSRPGDALESPGTGIGPVLGDVLDSDALGASAPRIDLYGNEVEDAVGDYRIDRGGAIYERHSPDTEVTQLAAPRL